MLTFLTLLNTTVEQKQSFKTETASFNGWCTKNQISGTCIRITNNEHDRHISNQHNMEKNCEQSFDYSLKSNVVLFSNIMGFFIYLCKYVLQGVYFHHKRFKLSVV